MIALDTPLARIHGLSARFCEHLAKLRLHTVRDLLWHFPFRYEDFSEIYPIANLEPGQQATIQGVVEDIDLRRSWRKNLSIVEATIADETGRIRAVWFNQPYVKNILKPGRFANFSGKVTVSDGELSLSHPVYELLSQREAREDTKHTARLVPVYPETRGLTSKGIRFVVQPILKAIDGLREWIPENTLRENGLPDLVHALRGIHFPSSLDEAERARRRFAFEDLFLLQLFNFEQKLALKKESAPAIVVDIAEIKDILARLPFALTQSQKQSLWEIAKDLHRSEPMNRLLQGDVGSGKTIVAALAAALVSRAGYQTVFLAPTEILAVQHFRTLQKTFHSFGDPLRHAVGLLTASHARALSRDGKEIAAQKSDLKQRIARGELAITVGTHALIQKSVSFGRLGLVVIDEQHRFGVEQRAALLRNHNTKRSGSPAGFSDRLVPHFLSMSATPIPRTLMLTVFGDLDISTITELPAGRKPIVTRVVPPDKREAAYAFIRNEVSRGRQVFVICPRIEKPDESTSGESFLRLNQRALEVKSVKEEYKKLAEAVFPDLQVAMLHGQMPAKGKPKTRGALTKESVMHDFQKGKTDILVSTSVVEVGVDVPNASIMMIEGADRFGLAQLYQFRGRVGRGNHQSYCLLFTDSASKTARERLAAIAQAKNGFELAEKDLALRGPGEFLGQKQTGLPDVAMRALQDTALISASRSAAAAILRADPALKNHPALRDRLRAFKEKIHQE